MVLVFTFAVNLQDLMAYSSTSSKYPKKNFLGYPMLGVWSAGNVSKPVNTSND